jgi:tryptophan synthase alpha subunit
LSTPKEEMGKAVCHTDLPMEHAAFITTIHRRFNLKATILCSATNIAYLP